MCLETRLTVDIKMAARCSSNKCGLSSETFDRKLLFASPKALEFVVIVLSLPPSDISLAC